jgi:hypothetical protein
MTLAKTFFFSLSDYVVDLWEAIFSITEEEESDELRVI